MKQVLSASRFSVAKVVLAAAVVSGVTMALGASPVSAGGTNLIQNGGFESGSFTPGWTTSTEGAGEWEVTSTGVPVCCVTNAPIEGVYSAMFTQYDPAGGILLSDPFTVPPGGQLSLEYAYDNAAGVWAQDSEDPYGLGEDENQWLRIDVIKASAEPDSLSPSDILATIFNSQSGSPVYNQTWTTGSADLSAFAGQSVEVRVVTASSDFFLPVWLDNVQVLESIAPPQLGVSTADQSVNGTLGQTITATWNGVPGAVSYTCTLMYGLGVPSSFTVTTPSKTCSFGFLSPTTEFGIQVVANFSDGSTSPPSSAFAAPPPLPAAPPTVHKATIVCENNRTHQLKAVTAVHPRCSRGWHRVG